MSRQLPTLGKPALGSQFQWFRTWDLKLNRVARRDDWIERVAFGIGDMPGVAAVAILNQLEKRGRIGFGRVIKDIHPLSKRAASQ